MEINKIYNMDCIEFMKQLEDKSIDLIVIDPPYGLNYNENDMASLWEAIFNGKKERMKPNPIQGDGEEESIELFEKFLIESKRILKKGSCCCCCCGGGGPKPLFANWTLLMDKHIGFKQAIVWDKGGLGMGFHYRRNYEFMLIAQNGVPIHRWNGGNTTPNVVRIGKIIPNSEQHPTEKPLKLFEYFIKLHSNKGDLVLDPFCGSGVTAEACLRLDRNFICIDKDKRFYDMSEKRINGWKKQSKLNFFEDSK